MEIQLEDGDSIRIVAANRTLNVAASRFLIASSPHVGAVTVLEISRSGRISLLLFDHVDDFRRWVAFRNENLTAYRILTDASLEKITESHALACPQCNGKGTIERRVRPQPTTEPRRCPTCKGKGTKPLPVTPIIETIKHRLKDNPADTIVVDDDEFERLVTEIQSKRDPRVFHPQPTPGAPIVLFGARVVAPDGSTRAMP